MKYFLPEYLNITKEAEIKWEKACNEYAKYVEEHAKIFTKVFLKEYYNGGFHDYLIRRIDMNFVDKKFKETILNIIIELEKNDKKYYFVHEEVKSCNMNNNEINNKLFNFYLYGEYYKDEEGFWNHNFLFTNNSEMNITCKNFIFKTIDKS